MYTKYKVRQELDLIGRIGDSDALGGTHNWIVARRASSILVGEI